MRPLPQAADWVLGAWAASVGPARLLPSSAGWDCCAHLSLTGFLSAKADEDTCSFLWSTGPVFRENRKGIKNSLTCICSVKLGWKPFNVKQSGLPSLAWKSDVLHSYLSPWILALDVDHVLQNHPEYMYNRQGCKGYLDEDSSKSNSQCFIYDYAVAIMRG